MEDLINRFCSKDLRKKRSLSALDKINNGVSIMAVVFLIFRKQFELLNTNEAETVITQLRSQVPSLRSDSSLEEISAYLHTLPRQEFSSLIKQLIVVCEDYKKSCCSFLSAKDLGTAN